MKSTGTTVLLIDWGIEQAWLATPEVGRTKDPKYAGIISTYMDLTNASATAHLRETRSFPRKTVYPRGRLKGGRVCQ